MKIGIITFHRSQNYGALLQAYGLQQFVKKLGQSVSFVDYWPDYHEEMYKPFSLQKFNRFSVRGKVKYIFQFIFTFCRLRKRRKKTQAYIKRYLDISPDTSFDMVLYGSDQIWRKQHQPTYDWFDPVYWGEGLVDTSHKVAYAASMGKIEIDLPKDVLFVREHLSLFDAISIREKDLIERLKTEYGNIFPMVCDPVFLLEKEEWIQHVNMKYIPKHKYILYYRLQKTKATDEMVEELKEKTGDYVIEMRGYIPLFHYGRKYRFTADAQEFISLIYGADYVVTSSFHGLAMSIIFEKQFYFCSLKHLSNRAASLLNQLGLESRFAAGDAYKIKDDVIDYAPVREKLGSFANFSRTWLSSQIDSLSKEK